MTLAHQADAAVPGLFDDLDPSRVEIAIRLEEDDGALAFGPEKFDSDVFGLQVGRILAVRAGAPQRHQALLDALIPRVRTLGYAQVLRRVPATGLDEIWALERSGFELMDIGLTFGRTLDRPITAPTYPDLVVRPSTDADLEQMVVAMLELPWGSRYEADPHYSVAQVRELRTRWLWNSHRGRAAAFLIGAIDGQPAGYVTCLLDERSRHGEIELVGTLPGFRGRRVASRIIDHAVAWFSTRAARVTVRTQATNYAAAALYEKSGFTLDFSDLTFRLAVKAANSAKVL